MKNLLEIRGDKLYFNDEPFYIASGDMHYFRFFRGGWERRLRFPLWATRREASRNIPLLTNTIIFKALQAVFTSLVDLRQMLFIPTERWMAWWITRS